MNRPDLAAVLAAHRSVFQCDGDYGEMQWVECSCGDEYWVDTAAGYDEHEAHLAAVLNAAVDAWLADEKTREAVAEVAEDAHWCESNYTHGCNCHDWRLRQATGALAALTQREDTP